MDPIWFSLKTSKKCKMRDINLFSTPLSPENMGYNWKLWHTEFNNLQPKAFVWCRVGWNGSILDIFHVNTTRQIFSQSSIKQERPQSQNRLRKAQKAWHVKDPWVAGALRAPQSLFARLTHSIFEALPPFARSIPASQTVGFTTRCHQRPWLGWQIELATRAYSHTRKHTHHSLLNAEAVVSMSSRNLLHRDQQEKHRLIHRNAGWKRISLCAGWW